MVHGKLFKEVNAAEVFSNANSFGIDYLHESFTRNIYPEDSAIKSLEVFDQELQEEFTPSQEVLNLLHTYGSPAAVAQTGGRYFGFVNGSMVPAGLAARLLSDYWDQNTAMQVISPVASKLESVVQGWLIDLFGLPERTVAGFVSGSAMAAFCSLAAARFRLLKNKGWDINKDGLFQAPRLKVVTGKHAHSTVFKALNLLGFGETRVELVDTDSQGRLNPGALPQLDDSTILIIQAGNVNTGAFDNIDLLCQKANRAGAWTHIDGAFGLCAQLAEELKYLTKGMEKADSWSLDGHKTLNTPYDNGIVLCADEDALTSALRMSGPYIVPGQRDGMSYTPEMSRRARIVELWATLKSLGKSGLSEMVYGLHARAKQFSEQLKSEGFEILNNVVFNQILVYYKDDDTTRKILKDIQEQRICWCGGSKWMDKDVIRISVCSWATTAEDVTDSVKSFAIAKNRV